MYPLLSCGNPGVYLGEFLRAFPKGPDGNSLQSQGGTAGLLGIRVKPTAPLLGCPNN